MLVNIPYPRKSRAWNFRLFGLLSLFLAILSFFFSFMPNRTARANVFIDREELGLATAGEFSVLTYNVAGLPQLISSAKTPRASSIKRIGARIGAFDIVNVQEDFNYNEYLYADNGHPYRTEAMGSIPFSDGLSTLSKYPIVEIERIAWKHCSGADCLTPKGFSYMRIQLGRDVFLDVYNLHATAQDNPDAVKARRENLQQFAAYLKAHSSDEAVLIMGDFNAHYAFSEDNIRYFKEETGMRDGWVELQQQGKVPVIRDSFKAGLALDIDEHCESIDKIYFRSSDRLAFEAKSYRVEKDLFEDESGLALSDHCAVSMQFEWKIIGDKQDSSLSGISEQKDNVLNKVAKL